MEQSLGPSSKQDCFHYSLKPPSPGEGEKASMCAGDVRQSAKSMSCLYIHEITVFTKSALLTSSLLINSRAVSFVYHHVFLCEDIFLFMLY